MMKRHAKTMSTPHSRLVDSLTEKLVTSVTHRTVPRTKRRRVNDRLLLRMEDSGSCVRQRLPDLRLMWIHILILIL